MLPRQPPSPPDARLLATALASPDAPIASAATALTRWATEAALRGGRLDRADVAAALYAALAAGPRAAASASPVDKAAWLGLAAALAAVAAPAAASELAAAATAVAASGWPAAGASADAAAAVGRLVAITGDARILAAACAGCGAGGAATAAPLLPFADAGAAASRAPGLVRALMPLLTAPDPAPRAAAALALAGAATPAAAAALAPYLGREPRSALERDAAGAAAIRLAGAGALLRAPGALARLAALLASGPLALDGLLDAAEAGAAPGVGAAWLDAAAGEPGRALAPAAARALVPAAAAAGPAAAAAALDALAAAASRLSDRYGAAAVARPRWLGAPELARGLRAALDAAFLSALAAARALAPAAGGHPAALAAALDMLACVSFARVPVPAHGETVAALVGALAAARGGGDALLARAPPPERLAAAMPPSDQPAWLADPVLAARVHALLAALAPSAATLARETARSTAFPLALLYLRHPAPPLAAAAHGLAAAVMRGEGGAGGELGPAYLDAALSPAAPPSPALALGVAAAVASCPPGSALGLLAGRRVAAAVGAEARSASVPTPRLDCLAAAAAAALLQADPEGAADCGRALERELAGAPRAAATAAVDGVGAALAAADDAVRKPALARWWQAWAGRGGGRV
jgi:hypothetical protein